MESPLTQIFIQKIADGTIHTLQDNLATEEPLEIRLSYVEQQRIEKTISITMRTPGSDDELGAGFLFNEGIIQSKEQLAAATAIAVNENKVLISLHENTSPHLQQADRNFYTTSSCGVCGKSSMDAIRTVSPFQQQPDDIRIASSIITGLSDTLQKQQALFNSTGGLHASALFDLAGNFITLREDVGRHNALDKLIGNAFLQNNLPLGNHILLLSGRASFELIQKAVMAGIKVVAAIGAPSSLAVHLAKENGTTLIGFLRSNRFNIYAGSERIIL